MIALGGGFGDGKAKAAAFDCGRGRAKKSLEDLWQRGLIDTRSVILNFDDCRRTFAVDRDVDIAGRLSVADRIVEQVGEDGVDIGFVRKYVDGLLPEKTEVDASLACKRVGTS